MTASERRAKTKIPEYEKSYYTSLDDCYERYSHAKARAWNYCEELCKNHDGWGLRIISYNMSIFTAGFQFNDPETHVRMFMYITPSYDTAVEYPEEREVAE